MKKDKVVSLRHKTLNKKTVIKLNSYDNIMSSTYIMFVPIKNQLCIWQTSLDLIEKNSSLLYCLNGLNNFLHFITNAKINSVRYSLKQYHMVINFITILTSYYVLPVLFVNRNLTFYDEIFY